MSKKDNQHNKLLDTYCPKRQTDYEVAETVYFLKNTCKVPYSKIIKRLGISFNTMKRFLTEHEDEIKANQKKRMEQARQEITEIAEQHKDSNK